VLLSASLALTGQLVKVVKELVPCVKLVSGQTKTELNAYLVKMALSMIGWGAYAHTVLNTQNQTNKKPVVKFKAQF